MTIKKDNFEGRVNKLGQGHEQTVGVPADGMQDPTGEYPKRDYNFGSSLNTASRGITINELDIGGGYPGGSVFGHNDLDESELDPYFDVQDYVESVFGKINV